MQTKRTVNHRQSQCKYFEHHKSEQSVFNTYTNNKSLLLQFFSCGILADYSSLNLYHSGKFLPVVKKTSSASTETTRTSMEIYRFAYSLAIYCNKYCINLIYCDPCRDINITKFLPINSPKETCSTSTATHRRSANYFVDNAV